jgi:hypothetical protein
MSRIGCSEIDVEANPVCLEVESDHPSIGEKAVGFAHRKNGLAAQALQDLRLPPAFLATEKENVAAEDSLSVAQQTDVQYAFADEFAFQCALDRMPLRVIIEDANV